MAFDDKGSTKSGEIGLFDIADWIWDFRWLVIGFITLALMWTGITFWTVIKAKPVSTNFVVTTTIYPSGTPVRNVPEIASILRSRLTAMSLRFTSALGDNPVVVNVPTSEAAEKVIAIAEALAEDLISDVQAEVNTLTPFMSNDNVPNYIAAQYIKDVAFLAGQSRLIRLLDPVISKRPPDPVQPNRMQFLMPWLLCGSAFFAIAGGVTFTKKWKEHLFRKRLKGGQGGEEE